MGAGTEGKDAAPADAEDHDKACGLPIPATTLLTANHDHDDAQSPPPLNHPPTWTLGASAPSEDLGTPQLNGMSAGMAAKDTAPADAEDHDKARGLPIPATTLLTAKPDHDEAQSPPPLNHPPTWTLGAYAPSEDLGTPQSNGMGAGMAGRDAAAEAAENEDQAADARGIAPTEFEEEDEKEAQEEEEEGEEEEEEEEEEDEEEGENEEEAEEGATLAVKAADKDEDNLARDAGAHEADAVARQPAKADAHKQQCADATHANRLLHRRQLRR